MADNSSFDDPADPVTLENLEREVSPPTLPPASNSFSPTTRRGLTSIPPADLRSANISPQASPQARWRTNTTGTASSPPSQPALEVGGDDSMKMHSSPEGVAQQSLSEESADQLSDIPASPPKRSIAVEGAGGGTRSLSPQSTGGLSPGRTPQVLTASMTGRMFSSPERAGRTKTFGSASPTCPKCGKAVYFAEQVG